MEPETILQNQTIAELNRMEQGKARSFEELVAIGKARGYSSPVYWAKRVWEGRKHG